MITQHPIDINGKSYFISVEKPSIGLLSKLSAIQDAWKSYRDNKFNTMITPYIAANQQMTRDDQINFIVSELGEDFQWNWEQKAFYIFQKPDEYDCFTISSLDSKGAHIAEALLIAFHPKQSEQEQGRVFYVDYLASAPWNRDSIFPNQVVKIKGLGSHLLKFSSKYYKESIQYKAGFLLHSLPKAEGFYMKIGMVDLGIDTSKENLRKFEMLEQACINFMGQ